MAKKRTFDPRAFGFGFDRGERFTLERVLQYVEDSDNAVYYWMIRSIYREKNLPVPECVESYLDKVAERLMELVARAGSEKSEGKIAADVYRALGLAKKGSRTLLNRFEIAKQDFLAAELVWTRVKTGEKVGHAVEAVAKEMTFSSAKVRKAYDTLKNKQLLS